MYIKNIYSLGEVCTDFLLGVSVITYLLGSLGNNKDNETVLYTN